MSAINSPDVQIWIAAAGGGDAVVRVSGDSTVAAGSAGFDLVAMLQGDPQLFRPTDIMLDTVHDRYFLVDSDGTMDRILQGSISQTLAGGSPVLTALYSQPVAFDGEGITGVALDPNSGTIYFTERNLVQKIGYDIPGQTPVTLADLGFDPLTGGPNYANEIAFNPNTGQIFVASTESSTDFIESPPGSGEYVVGTILFRNAIFRVDGVSASDTGDTGNTVTKLTWATHEQNSPVLGGPDTEAFPDELGIISSLDVYTATGEVYFTTVQLNGGANGEVGGIYRVPSTGGAHTVLYSETAATNQNFQYIDVDSAGGRYWVTSAEPGVGSPNKLYVHDLSAGAPIDFASIGTAGGLSPLGLNIVNAPTLAASSANAVATETAGSGSGFGASVQPLASIDANDFDTAGLVDQLAGARVRISEGFNSVPGHAERLTINGTTNGSLNFGSQNIAYNYDGATGVMTLTGVSSFANYEAALALVAYAISGDNPDDYGAAPTRAIAYSVSDGLLASDEQEVTIAIAATNDAPVNLVGSPVLVLEGSPVAITGLAVSDADADPANDTISVTLSVGLGSLSVATGQPGGIVASQVAGNGTGTVVITASQNAINATFGAANGVIYTAFAGGLDALTVTTSDLGQTGTGGAQQDVDAVAITVIPLNDPPTAPSSSTVSTAEDNQSAATAIGAADPDGDTLTYSVRPGAGAAHGSVSFNQANGTYSYAPNANFNGSDGFTILVSDGKGGTAEQVVSVTVTPVNDAPTAPAAGSVTTAEDTASAATAIGASDIDGDSLSYAVKSGAGAANGSVSFNQANGTYAYTPNANFNGSDSFTIVISDGNGGSAEQVVAVTVTPVNDAPTAPATGMVSTVEDTASAATAIGAADLDGDTLTYAVKPGAGAAHGSVSFNQANGTYSYAPNANFNGSDGFTVLISDGKGGTAEQVVSVTVTPVNDAPTAPAARSVTTAEDAASAATAIGASDIDGDSLSYSIKPGAGAANGSVSFNQANGTYSYAPNANFNGSDSFTLVVSDGKGGAAEQVVSVTVTPVNDAPTAPATGAVSTDEDTASAATAIGAADIDGDTLTYSVKPGAGAANGNVSFNQANGTYTYIPVPNFTGSDAFTILISDGHGGTAQQAVSVTVANVNDAPTGVNGNLVVSEYGATGTFAGTIVGVDPDSSSFSYQLLDNAGGLFAMDAHGNVTAIDPLRLDFEQHSSHAISVRVTDDKGAASDFSIAVNIADVLGENVFGDGRANTFFGGAQADTLRGGIGADVLRGGGGKDVLDGGDGNDLIDGGAGADTLTGGGGNDIFVLRKGEANGDTIIGFFGRGAADGDSIQLEGFGDGTLFYRVGGGSSTTFRIDDHGWVETLTIIATGQIHSTDYSFDPNVHISI